MADKTDPFTLLIHELDVTVQPIDRLTPYSNNARTHTDQQIRQIAESIKTFGFNNPVLVDAAGGIVAGHGRVDAAKLLGMTEIPTIRLDHMTPAQRKAYILADNRLAELAGWDKEMLAIEFQELEGMDLDFDLNVTGFEMPDIDLMIQSLAPDPLDELPEVDKHAPVICRNGDYWQLGEHALLCADSLKETSYTRLMAGRQARMIITDPPYNVPINGHVCGLGAVSHAEFTMASGEKTPEEFIRFLATVFTLLVQHSLPGSLHYAFMDWRHMREILAAGASAYTELKNLCVWNKDNGGMGSFYRSKHELVFVFKCGTEPHINNVQLGRHGRYRTNVWDYPGINSFGEGRDEALRMHPTVKPVALLADAILDASNRGDCILDAFGGSGSTLLAAEQTGRRAHLIEIEPRFVDVTIRRWEHMTGQSAVHADTGFTFEAMACQRHGPPGTAIASSTSTGGLTDGQ